MSRPADSVVSTSASPSQLPRIEPLQHTEESLRQWLRAKAEEDRRRQEEERTRQENLKLEQRRIEHSMLRDAIQAGIPPQMVPFIFLGIGGGNFSVSPEIAEQIDTSIRQAHSWQDQQQQYRRTQASQQQTIAAQPPHPPSHGPDLSQPPPPEIRRDNNRAIPPNPYASQSVSINTTSPPQPMSPTQTQVFRGSFQPIQLQSISDSQSYRSSMPRLSTNEPQFSYSAHNVASTPAQGAYSSVPVSAPPPASIRPDAQTAQSPSIYFHHWVPPTQSQPSTPSVKGRQESTSRAHGLSETQVSSPGRKRKAVGSHPPPPPPMSIHLEQQQQQQRSPTPPHSSRNRADSTRETHDPNHYRQQSDPGYRSRREQSGSDSDQHTRFRPGRESILNPVPLISRRKGSGGVPEQPPGR